MRKKTTQSQRENDDTLSLRDSFIVSEKQTSLNGIGLVQKRSEVLNLDHVLSPIAIVRHIEAMGDYNWFFAQAEVND